MVVRLSVVPVILRDPEVPVQRDRFDRKDVKTY